MPRTEPGRISEPSSRLQVSVAACPRPAGAWPVTTTGGRVRYEPSAGPDCGAGSAPRTAIDPQLTPAATATVARERICSLSAAAGALARSASPASRGMPDERTASELLPEQIREARREFPARHRVAEILQAQRVVGRGP